MGHKVVTESKIKLKDLLLRKIAVSDACIIGLHFPSFSLQQFCFLSGCRMEIDDGYIQTSQQTPRFVR